MFLHHRWVIVSKFDSCPPCYILINTYIGFEPLGAPLNHCNFDSHSPVCILINVSTVSQCLCAPSTRFLIVRDNIFHVCHSWFPSWTQHLTISHPSLLLLQCDCCLVTAFSANSSRRILIIRFSKFFLSSQTCPVAQRKLLPLRYIIQMVPRRLSSKLKVSLAHSALISVFTVSYRFCPKPFTHQATGYSKMTSDCEDSGRCHCQYCYARTDST